MEWIIAILIILLVLVLICNVFSKDIDARAISCFCAIIISVLFTGALIIYNYEIEPTALDVYEGKTTLEITYRDSVPIDSVVVFKEEFKK
jgi:hypothetical protein